MAWGFFFNMEKLSLSIAENHIKKMTNDNYYDDASLDSNKILNNLENGFVAITQLSCYFESFLNTIINSCMNYDGDILLKCSIDEKIDIIFMHYKKDFSNIKSMNCWALYRTATRVRNEMIHFKRTYIGDGSGIPDFIIGKVNIADYFTQNSINKTFNGYICLCKMIAETLGLKIFEKIDVFAAKFSAAVYERYGESVYFRLYGVLYPVTKDNADTVGEVTELVV